MKKLKLAAVAAALTFMLSLAQPALAVDSKTAYYSRYQMWGCSSTYYYDDGQYRGTIPNVSQSPIGDNVNYYCSYMGTVYRY